MPQTDYASVPVESHTTATGATSCSPWSAQGSAGSWECQRHGFSVNPVSVSAGPGSPASYTFYSRVFPLKVPFPYSQAFGMPVQMPPCSLPPLRDPATTSVVLFLVFVLPSLPCDLTLLEDRPLFPALFPAVSRAWYGSGSEHRMQPLRGECGKEQNCLEKTLSGPAVSLSENLIKT